MTVWIFNICVKRILLYLYLQYNPWFIYRTTHIILDYLQALTPKYAHNTQKTWYFLQKKIISAFKIFLLDP